MYKFIHEFMECEGIPVLRSSSDCMNYLENVGYSFNVSRGIIGRAVAMGWIKCTSCENGIKYYS